MSKRKQKWIFDSNWKKLMAEIHYRPGCTSVGYAPVRPFLYLDPRSTLHRPKPYFDFFGQTLLRPKLYFDPYFSINKKSRFENRSIRPGRSRAVEVQKRWNWHVPGRHVQHKLEITIVFVDKAMSQNTKQITRCDTYQFVFPDVPKCSKIWNSSCYFV